MNTLDSRALDTLRQVVRWLVVGDFQAVENRSEGVRLTSEMMRRAIEEYGRTLVMPPEEAFLDIDAIDVLTSDLPTWSIRFDLWTKEERHSDLSLECTIIVHKDGSIAIEIDNIHVP